VAIALMVPDVEATLKEVAEARDGDAARAGDGLLKGILGMI